MGANNTPGGNEVVRLNNTQPAGPTLALAVSPGDQVNLETWAYYEAGNNYHNTISSTTMIAAIASAFGGVLGAPGEAGEIYSAINDAFTTGGAALGGTGNPNLPGAYMAYLVFDVNRNLTMPLQAGYFRVTTSGNMAKEKISSPTLTMEHPGYIYVFLYNRSNSANWVYFDDFKVTHQRSPIVAGADFYPFGLPMEGREITQENYRWGYQGQYAEKDTVTGWNQFQLRMYDARFGRWLSVDPYGEFYSPYLGQGNNPVSNVDPDGGCISCNVTAMIQGLSAEISIATAAMAGTLLNEVVVTGARMAGMGTLLLKDGFKEWWSNISGPVGGVDFEKQWREEQLRNRRASGPDFQISFDVDPSELMNLPVNNNTVQAIQFRRNVAGAISDAYEVVTDVGLALVGPELVGAKALGAAVSALYRSVRATKKAIVIGERMNDVRRVGRTIGAKWYQAWGKNFPVNSPEALEHALARNRRWIEAKIKKGYKIYDIGPVGNNSPFYKLEKEILKIHKYPTTPIKR